MIITSNKFTWNENTGVAEISDFGPEFQFGRVSDGNHWVIGITVISAKTGLEVIFALEKTDKRDGDILGWHFVAVKPNDKQLKLLIIND